MNTLIRGATVVTPLGLQRADIRIANSQIVDIAPDLTPLASEALIDADGLHAFPGLIDSHVHFRDPGQTSKEDFDTGSAAAAAGGVTTVLCMPNTIPPLADPAAFELARQRGLQLSRVDFGLEAVVTPDNVEQLAPLSEAGAISFEVFLGGVPEAIPDPEMLARVFATLAQLDCVAGVTAADHELRQRHQTSARATGRTDALIFADAYPAEIELNGIQQAYDAAVAACSMTGEYIQPKLHFRQIHTADSVRLLAKLAARANSVDLTSEVSPHHLFLTREALTELRGHAQMIPPLRYSEDNRALLQGLHDGIITTIATDHAPHEHAKKSQGDENIWQSPPGVPTLETLLATLITSAQRGEMTFSQIAQWTAAEPARIFRLKGKGHLQPGYDADIVLVDTQATDRVNSSRHFTRAKSSPFEQQTLSGQVVWTVRRGDIIYWSQEGCSLPGGGRMLTPQTRSVRGRSA